MSTQDQIKEQLSYNSETGVFVWLVGKKMAGKIAGTLTGQGYLQIGINGKLYLAHRLAWLYVCGAMPDNQLDHVNCVKSDNRICNLRECTDTENHFNIGIQCNNRSGFKGVCWDKRDRKWRAQIRVGGKTKYIGGFATPELASAAYNTKAVELHGDFYKATV